MNTRKRYLVVGGTLTAVALAALLLFGNRPAVHAQGSQVGYTFGRHVRADEHTYDWYRRTHADAAAARYGIPASIIGDGHHLPPAVIEIIFARNLEPRRFVQPRLQGQ